MSASKIWDFFNSAFALWFLSSVVVAGITWIYTERKQYLDEQTKINDLRKKLGTEINYRIENGVIQINLDLKRVAAQKEKFSPYQYYYGEFVYLNNEVYNQDRLIDYSIYPEFKSRRFRSLLRELGNAVASNESESLREADKLYVEIEALVDDTYLKEKQSNVDVSVAVANEENIQFMKQKFLKLQSSKLIQSISQ